MDDGGSPIIIGMIIFLVLIFIDAIVYAYGAAIQNLSEGDLLDEEQEPKRRQQILDIKEHPAGFIDTTQIISVLVSIITGILIARHVNVTRLEELLNMQIQNGLGASVIHILLQVVAVAFFLILLYVFGIHLPKLAGKNNAKKYAYGYGGAVSFIVIVLSPFTAMVRGAANLLAKAMRIYNPDVGEDVTEEEIISMVNEGHEHGVLEASEAEMIHNIFEFGDKEAADIMTHRKNIVAVRQDLTLEEALHFMLEESNSRFPVCEEDIDSINGILHLKDAMKCHTLHQYDNWLLKDIPDLIRPAIFIPETRNISQLFSSMQAKKLHMVIVVDEYGQTAGLVALEDILEEIVGNIMDEYDEEETFIETVGENQFLMEGLTPLEEVEEALQVEFNPEEDIETLNGYLVSKLELIPDPNETYVVEDNGYAFYILSVSNNIIDKVKVVPLSKEETSEEKEEK